jgi:hypothetical protein
VAEFELKIKSGDAAIVDAANYEIADMLRKAANKVADFETEGVLFDSNGNKVGSWFLDLGD